MMNANSGTSRPVKATNAPNSPSPMRTPGQRDPAPFSLATHTLIIVAGLLLAFLFAPRFPVSVRELFNRTQHWRASSPSITLRNPLVFQDPAIYPNPEQRVEFKGTFNTKHERSMTLADQAKRVAAEFDFEKDAVNKAVKEFIREMGA